MDGRFCFLMTILIVKHLPKIIFGVLLLGLCFISLLAQLDLTTGVSSQVQTPVPTDTPTPVPTSTPSFTPLVTQTPSSAVPTVPSSNPPAPIYNNAYCGRVNQWDPNNPFRGWPTSASFFHWATVTAVFCDASYGQSWEHEGIDLAYYLGSPVVATASGVVIQAGYESGLGNTVTICSNGFCARYGHMQQIASGIFVGTTVSNRQEIGVVGNTGNAFGVHLHYDMYDANGFLDPGPTLDK